MWPTPVPRRRKAKRASPNLTTELERRDDGETACSPRAAENFEYTTLRRRAAEWEER